MLSLIFIIFVLIFIISIVICFKTYHKEGDPSVFAVIVALGSFIVSLFLFLNLYDSIKIIATAHTIEQKIDMYEEENARIEEDIDLIVKDSMDFETELFSNLKPESSITLVTKYPDLTSDTHIQKQIEIHTANNDKIRQLREQLIDVSVHKFLVYFGK